MEFLGRFNELVDNLNGAHSAQHKKLNNPRLAPYESTNDFRFEELIQFWKYMQDWREEVNALPNMSKEDKAAKLLSVQTLKGLEITIRSFICCTKFLLRNGTKFIMARVFQQDPIEHYFSQQRGALGGSRNPDCAAYYRNVGLIHVQGKMKMKRKGSNTEHVQGDEEEYSRPLKKRPRKLAPRSLLPIPENEPFEELDNTLAQDLPD